MSMTIRRRFFLVAFLLALAAGLLVVIRMQIISSTDSGNDQRAPGSPVKLVVSRDSERPILITNDGRVLQPVEDGGWQPLPHPTPINDMYMDTNGLMWAVTEQGLFIYQSGEWKQANDVPAQRIISTHGYVFALGQNDIARVPGGKPDPATRLLTPPDSAQPAKAFVMLGNHSHVLQNGNEVFVSPDLGLSWRPLEAPAAVDVIGVDAEANLLATTEQEVLRWNWREAAWQTFAPLPDDLPITAIESFKERLYVIAGGQLYMFIEDRWQAITFPEAGTVNLTDMAVKYPDTLWLLDSAHNRLLFSQDEQAWSTIDISA